MRKLLIIITLLCLVLCLGCSEKPEPKDPVHLYYSKAEISFEELGVVSFEVRESSELTAEEIIRLYLAGPTEQGLISPFPDDTSLISIHVEDQSVTVTLSDTYASLSGYPLAIANCCLYKTVSSLTGLKTVIICCETKALGNDVRMQLTEQDFVLVDQSTGYTSAQSSSIPKSIK